MILQMSRLRPPVRMRIQTIETLLQSQLQIILERVHLVFTIPAEFCLDDVNVQFEECTLRVAAPRMPLKRE